MMLETIEFKTCLSKFASGVTVITTCNKENEKVGVTISAFSTLSLSPPLILFCLGKKAFTINEFKECNKFAVCMLAEKQQQISNQFAYSEDPWQGVESFKGEYGSDIIANCIAYLECEKYQEIDGGDHIIFVGLVLNAKTLSNSAPLIHYQSDYFSLKENKLITS
jgi:flavin reductase (DIM6/NTAB) family NADH-FMN oxidoreductase RutF